MEPFLNERDAPVEPNGSRLESGSAESRAIAEFRLWVSKFQNQSLTQPAEALEEGGTLAMFRRQALLRLIQTRPSDALASAVSPSMRASLPPQVRQYVEEHVSGYGRITKLVVCGSKAEEHWSVRLGDRLYLAYGDLVDLGGKADGRKVPIHGIAIGSTLAVARQPARLLGEGEDGSVLSGCSRCAECGRRLTEGEHVVKALLGGCVLPLCRPGHLDLLNAAVAGADGGITGTAPGPPPDWTQGSKTLLYIIAQYSDQGSPPASRAASEAALEQVSQYFHVQSYQQTTVTSTVTDPVVLPRDAAYYTDFGLGQVYNDAVAAARTAGWDADDYDFVFIRHANGPGGIGVGLVSEKGAWVQTDSWSVIAHELGHNYGLNHANAWRPGTTSPYGPGATIEYGDPYDLMGSNRGSFNPYEKCVLHWMPEGAMARVTNSGIYRLHAFDVSGIASNQIYALRISKDVRDYWLDYRGEFQSGPYAPFTLNGLQVRWSPWSRSRGGTTLLDMTPGTPRRFEDGPLAMGHTYSDMEAGVHLTVVDSSPTPGQWLDVAVSFDASPSNHPPSMSISASATNTAVGQLVTFQVSATDPDGDDLAYGWETTVDGSLVPFASSSNSPVVALSWAVDGISEVRCQVSDMKGGIARRSLLITVGSPDDYFISGSVTNGDGTPLIDALVYSLDSGVSLAGTDYVQHASYRSARTDEEGSYRLLNLPAGQHAIHGLPTSSQTFSVTGGNGQVTVGPSFAGVDLVGIQKTPAAVRGVVHDGSNPVANAMVSVAGLSASTLADGSFAISNLPPASYMLSTSKDDQQFVAPSNPVYVDGEDANSNSIYRVLYQVSGEIRGALGPVIVGTGEPGRTAMALPNFEDFSKPWIYKLAIPGGLWNLEATLGGYTLHPDGFTNPVAIVGTDMPYASADGVQPISVTNRHFNAVPGTTYGIRGTVSLKGNAIAGLGLILGTNSAVSDSLGHYYFGGLAPGTYEVVPVDAGFTFTPGNALVNVVSQDVVGVDFAATASSKLDTLAMLTVSSNPAVPGSALVLSMTMSPIVSGSGVPTGTVQFQTNGVSFDSPVDLTNAVAQLSASSLPVGNYTVSADYSGDGSFNTTSAFLGETLVINTPPTAGPDVVKRLAGQGVSVQMDVLLTNDMDLDGDMLVLAGVSALSTFGATVTLSNGWVDYVPPAGLTNEDSFTYEIEDGRGGRATGVVTVIINEVEHVIESLSVELLNEDVLKIRFVGIPGADYTVEYNDLLAQSGWRELVTETADEQGHGEATDSLSPEILIRFYRLSR